MRGKYALRLCALVVAGAILVGCTTPTPQVIEKTVEVKVVETKEVVVTEEPAELSGDIVVWTMPNGADPQAAIDAEIAEFQKIYPNVSIATEIVGWGDAFGAIQTAVQGGEGPCITQMGTTWIPTFGSMGGLHTFTPAEIEELGGEAAFVAASYATGKVFDNLVAVPWFADVRGIYYRTDVFEQVGLDPDEAFEDLDSFMAALEAIRDSDVDIAPFVHPGRNDWNVWQNATQWGWAYGGDLLTADGTAAAFNSPEFVAGVTAFNGLYGRGLTPADALELNSAQCEEAFGKGRAATLISGPYMISNFRDLEGSGYDQEVADNVAVAPFPAGPTGAQVTFFGGSDLGIINTCRDYDAAFAFVKFLMSKESQIRYGNAIGMLPVTVEAQGDPDFTEDELFSVFIAAAPTGRVTPNVTDWGAIENTLNTALQGLWEDVAAADGPIDEATVQAKLDEAAETVDSILGQ